LAFTVTLAVEVGPAVQPLAELRLVKLTVLGPTFKLPAGMLIAVPLVIFVKLTVLPFTESEPE
jgi:predicted benzoate:H+ symporter BenE